MHIRKTPSMRYRPPTDPQPRPKTQTFMGFRQLAGEPPLPPSPTPQPLHFSFEKDTRKLCFSNLKNSIRPGPPVCDTHPNKKAKYRDRQSNKYHCFHCAIQMASQGRQLDQIEEEATATDRELMNLVGDCEERVLKVNRHLEQEYRGSKAAMMREMEAHRKYYEEIIERVADMQARDMIVFQEMMQNAERQFQTLTEDIMNHYHELQKLDVETAISKQQIVGICTKILQKTESSSNYKFPIVQHDHKIKGKMQSIETVLAGLRLQVRSPATATSVLSQILKSNSTFQSQKPRQRDQKIQKSVQDTPQSIKTKLSVCKSIVDPKQIKHISNIDFCESLMSPNLPTPSAQKSQLKQHRYKSDE